jgi:nicotinamide-nucleotide amidase
LNVYIKGISTQKLQENIKLTDEIINSKFKNYIYGYDNDELETVCAKLLKDNKITVALAESLTGGYISNKLTDPPGASFYFNYSEVVYTSSAKINILGVDKDIIEKHGAVSSECAVLMAENIRKKASSDIGLAVTGFAGPKGDYDNYPVGTVFIALSSANVKEVRRYSFSGSRTEIKNYTSKMALFWIYRLLSEMA